MERNLTFKTGKSSKTMTDVLIPFINYFIVLDSDGNRLLAKYYNKKSSRADQTKYEVSLHKKTKGVITKSEAEILLLDTEVVVFKSGIDCKFFISGSLDENELILVGVLDVLFDTISSLLRSQIDKRSMLDNLELILLTIDETIDNGNIMEMDSAAVSTRVQMKSSESTQVGQTAIGDLSIGQALSIAKDQFFKSLTRNDTY